MAAVVFDKQRFLRNLRRGVLTPAQLTYILCSAASNDKSGDAAATLLAAGADANAVSIGRPPLMWALMSGNLAVVRLLCAAGADLHARCADGEVGLVMSVFRRLESPDAATEDAYVDVLRALAEAGRDITRCMAGGGPFNTLWAAANQGKPKLVQLLLEAGAPVNLTLDPDVRATALHLAVTYPLFEESGVSPGEAIEQSLRCVKALLRAGADTRLRRLDGALAVETVLLVGDLRIADAIFAAEERRGILVDDEDAEREWPVKVKQERALRAAVAAYRITGDAVLPSALRMRPLEVLSANSLVELAATEAGRWHVVGNDGPVTGKVAFSKAALSADAVPSPELVARQAVLAEHAPREADATARRCCAPDCATLGALLKACPCHTSWYCSRECQAKDWRAHRKTGAHKDGIAARS